MEFDFDIPLAFTEHKFQEFAGYARKSGKVWTAGCPYCGEDSSWGKKRRLFLYPDTNTIFCFNCSINKSAYGFVKDMTGWSYQRIWSEVEKDTGDSPGDISTEIFSRIEVSDTPHTQTLPDDSINLFDTTQVSFYKDEYYVKLALSIIEKRRLDTARYRPNALYISLTDFIHKNRLLFPFYDKQGRIVFYQSRALTDSQSDKWGKYISKKDGDKCLFNINRLDNSYPFVYIIEGPADACFVKNGLAVTGLNLTEKQKIQLEALRPFFTVVWCLDNHMDNESTRNRYIELVKAGENVLKWPKDIKYKDFNEWCVDKQLDQIDPSFLEANTTKGGSALRI